MYALGIHVEYFSFDAFNIGMVTNGHAYFQRYASHVWTTMYNERCANIIFFSDLNWWFKRVNDCATYIFGKKQAWWSEKQSYSDIKEEEIDAARRSFACDWVVLEDYIFQTLCALAYKFYVIDIFIYFATILFLKDYTLNYVFMTTWYCVS